MKKLIIITGASSGMGVEFAKQLYVSAQADEMWLIARRKDKLETLCSELKQSSPSVIHRLIPRAVELDISGKSGAVCVREMLKTEAAQTPGGISIEILINNAGFGTYGTFENTSTEREMDMIELNCTTLTGICGYALPYMHSGSSLINVASLAAFMPLGNFAVYGATKAYVLSFTTALAAEVAEKGIKVTALCPGSVSTEFANVASNGARKEVLHGLPAHKVVAHCLKKNSEGAHIAVMAFKWKFSAFISRLFGRYFGARVTFLFNKRPSNPTANIQS